MRCLEQWRNTCGAESYAVMGAATLACLVACVKVHSVLQGLATQVAVQVFSKAAGNVSTVGDGGKVRRNGYLGRRGLGIVKRGGRSSVRYPSCDRWPTTFYLGVPPEDARRGERLLSKDIQDSVLYRQRAMGQGEDRVALHACDGWRARGGPT